jgi:hypothetical protein
MSDYDFDLVVLAADKHIKPVISALLDRWKDLRCRKPKFLIKRHPNSDPGCFNDAHSYLRPFLKLCERCLVVFDKEFDRSRKMEKSSREDLELIVEKRLAANGWNDRAAVVVIDPELEQWVWSPSSHVDKCLGWEGRSPDLRSWLKKEGMWRDEDEKPARPKEALDKAVHHVGQVRSAAVYGNLAAKVEINGCSDPSFKKLLSVLRTWFPGSSK